MKRATITVVVAIAVVAASTAAVAFWSLQRFLHAPASIPVDGYTLIVESGQSFSSVSNLLAAAGVIDHPDWYRWYARFTGDANAVRAGEYRLLSGESPADVLRKLVAGEVELHSFTIVPGWSFSELLDAMEASEFIQTSISYEDWPAMLQKFESAYAHPEGLFLPETYRIPRGTKDVDLLRQAYAMMSATLQAEWEGRDADLPLATPYEALILASIIEKETGRADERAVISGVFIRRLQKNMRLQTDPTVIYGIGPDYDGNITRLHLRTDTAYNTYTRHGLPPTPIALPGRQAINAALHPAAGEELFFVATGLGDGSHYFSVTKDEHDAAVRAYLKRLRASRKAQQGN